MPAYEIPLGPSPRRMTVRLAGASYRLRFFFANADGGGWCMDIADASGNPILCGIPLVTGADLLGQFGYLGFGGALFVRTDPGAADPPGYADLGVTAHLIWVPAA